MSISNKKLILFSIPEDGFLRAATIVELNDGFGRFGLVGYDNLAVVIEIPRFKQMQLQRSFILLFGSFPRKDEAKDTIP